MTNIQILTSDAYDYIQTFKDESIDLVILDPQYNDWDRIINDGWFLQTALDKLKPTGNLLCFTKQPFDLHLRIELEELGVFRREIIWCFDNGGAWVSNRMPLVSHQKIYWCTKTKDFFFQPRTGVAYKEITKNCHRANKVFEGYKKEGKDFEMSKDGVWLRDHLFFKKPLAGKIAAKPRGLMEILIRCYCPAGGSVCDPFTGSGIVPLICAETQRECFACDIDNDRVKAAFNKVTAEFAKAVGFSWEEVEE